MVALTVLLGLWAPVLLSGAQGQYQARLQLLLGPPAGGNSDAQSLERNMNSQIPVLRSPGTARAVAETVGQGLTAADLASATTIEQVAGSDVVLISAVSDDPELAADIVTRYAEVYLRERQERAQESALPELERLDQRLADVGAQITALNQQLAEAVAPFIARQNGPNPPSIPDPRTLAPEAAAQQQLLTAEYDRLLGLRQNVEERRRLVSPGSVLEGAVVGEQPAGPSPVRRLGILIAATLVGVAIAVASVRLSRRAVGEDDVQAELGQRLASRLPYEPSWHREPLTVLDPNRSATEPEGRLRVKIERLLPTVGTGVVAVTGVASRSGASTLVLSLAAQLSGSDRHVVVVDTDGGGGSLTEVLGLQPGGVRQVLMGADVDSVVEVVAPSVTVLTSTTGEKQSRGAVSQLTSLLENRADVVIFDSGPLLESATADEAAFLSHAVVVATPATGAMREQLREVRAAMADHLDRLLPVLTDPSRRPARPRTTGANLLPTRAVEPEGGRVSSS